MKKTITLLLTSVFCISVTFAQSNKVTISAQMHALTGLAYKTKARLFSSIFAPKQNAPFSNYVNQSSSAANINALANGLTQPPTLHYFNVLRILYGLDANFRIVLIFLPDVAVENTPNSNDFQFLISYPIPANTTVYLLDANGNFNASTYSNTAAGYVANYKGAGNITVNQYGDPLKPNVRALQFDYTKAQMVLRGIMFCPIRRILMNGLMICQSYSSAVIILFMGH